MRDQQLIEYLPEFLQNTRELNAIMLHGEQPEIQSLWNTLDSILKEQFIVDASEEGVTRWEKILKITPKPNSALNDRKTEIFAKSNENQVFTVRVLNKYLQSILGEPYEGIVVDNENFIVHVEIDSEYYNDVDITWMRSIIPCNMSAEIYVMYKKHEALSAYPHIILAQFTHQELREINVSNYLSTEVSEVQKQAVSNVEKFTAYSIDNFGFRKAVL